jgi:hypothetical protein
MEEEQVAADRARRHAEHGEKLQQQLRDLQLTVDPLVAARIYNDQLCPLASLPEELLLQMLLTIRDNDDAVSLACLRLVSAVFHRLTEKVPYGTDRGTESHMLLFHPVSRSGSRFMSCRSMP